jgi:hypothetical protein
MNWKIKGPNKAEDFQMLTGKLMTVFGFFLMFAENRDLPVKVTNTLTKFPESKSNTHPEGRALDISVMGWSVQDIEDCIKHMNLVAKDYGAISSATHEPNVIVYHDVGLGAHFHLQVRRD